MTSKKSTFALFFGNRGFFPSSLMASARRELPAVLKKLGHKFIMMDENATNHGAVETTREGEVRFYLGEGRFTEDPIPNDFFGCAGVAEIPNLQDVLYEIGQAGHRHHVSLTPGGYLAPVAEAFDKYLGYQVTTY
jgi:L-fucose isomerase-like protein